MLSLDSVWMGLLVLWIYRSSEVWMNLHSFPRIDHKSDSRLSLHSVEQTFRSSLRTRIHPQKHCEWVDLWDPTILLRLDANLFYEVIHGEHIPTQCHNYNNYFFSHLYNIWIPSPPLHQSSPPSNIKVWISSSANSLRPHSPSAYRANCARQRSKSHRKSGDADPPNDAACSVGPQGP